MIPDLVAIDAAHLFPAHTTWIGFRRGTLLRKYMYDFAQLLAPHLDRRLVERAHRAASAEEVRDAVCRHRAAAALGAQAKKRCARARGSLRAPAGRRRRSAERPAGRLEVFARGELERVEAAAARRNTRSWRTPAPTARSSPREPRRSRSSRPWL